MGSCRSTDLSAQQGPISGRSFLHVSLRTAPDIDAKGRCTCFVRSSACTLAGPAQGTCADDAGRSEDEHHATGITAPDGTCSDMSEQKGFICLRAAPASEEGQKPPSLHCQSVVFSSAGWGPAAALTSARNRAPSRRRQPPALKHAPPECLQVPLNEGGFGQVFRHPPLRSSL